jgi:putative sterol carrier protein
MTEFINAANISTEKKEKKETVFTHELSPNCWGKTEIKPSNFRKVLYIGNCRIDGDMFAAYINRKIIIYKGIKGDEFN